MGENRGDKERVRAESVLALPDLDPCREAGWIFRDGESVAIERQGDEPELPAGVQED